MCEKISAIKKFPDDEFLSIGMNPIQVEFMSEFSFKTEGTDTGIFEYPDWCNSKQSVIVWIGPKSKLFLFCYFLTNLVQPNMLAMFRCCWKPCQ